MNLKPYTARKNQRRGKRFIEHNQKMPRSLETCWRRGAGIEIVSKVAKQMVKDNKVVVGQRCSKGQQWLLSH